MQRFLFLALALLLPSHALAVRNLTLSVGEQATVFMLPGDFLQLDVAPAPLRLFRFRAECTVESIRGYFRPRLEQTQGTLSRFEELAGPYWFSVPVIHVEPNLSAHASKTCCLT